MFFQIILINTHQTFFHIFISKHFKINVPSLTVTCSRQDFKSFHLTLWSSLTRLSVKLESELTIDFTLWMNFIFRGSISFFLKVNYFCCLLSLICSKLFHRIFISLKIMFTFWLPNEQCVNKEQPPDLCLFIFNENYFSELYYMCVFVQQEVLYLHKQ